MVVQFVNDSESYGSLDLLSFALPCSLLNDPRFPVSLVRCFSQPPGPSWLSVGGPNFLASLRGVRCVRALHPPGVVHIVNSLFALPISRGLCLLAI